MSTTLYPTKMVASRAYTSRRSQIAIVAVLLLRAAGVLSLAVAASAAYVVTSTVEAATARPQRGVENRSAGGILIISRCRTENRSLSAGSATADLSGDAGGFASVGDLYTSSSMRNKTVDEKAILTDLEKTILTGQKLGVFKDFEGRQLLRCCQHGIVDTFVVNRLERRVTAALRKRAFSRTPFLSSRLYKGDFVFGYDYQGHVIRIYRQYLNAGTLIVAGTGAGKTNISKFQAIQIGPYVQGMWLVDIRKREFRSLRPIFARMGIDLKIVRSRKFRINPLQVPLGVEPIEYAAVAADFLVRVFNLPPRAATLLRTTITKLYLEHDILNGSQKYPTLFHLREAVYQDRQANPQARHAILDNLDAVLLSLGPEMLAYYRGWPVHELAQQHLVLELTGLPEPGKDLILNYLITAEFISRVARGLSNPGMDLWISFDEGQRLFSQRKETASYGGNALIDLTGLVRGTGIGLAISVLTTSDLSMNLPNLTSTKIIGRCGSLTEYTVAGRFVGMTGEQVEWCLHHMVPGMFIGQVGEGQWRYPFLFTVPLLSRVNIENLGVSDEDADASTEGIDTSKLLPA